MRKHLFILSFFCFVLGSLSAQQYDREGRLHEDILMVSYGEKYALDGYLSPLLYSGEQIGLYNQWWQGFRRDTLQLWVHMGEVGVTGSRTYQSSGKNLYDHLGVNAGWGAMRRWNWILGATSLVQSQALTIMLGPHVGFDFEARQIGLNTNKPYSFDLGMDVNLMAALDYTFTAPCRRHPERGRNTSYRLRYLLKLNMLGVEWLPEYGTSYYEITTGQIAQNISFSDFVNRHFLTHQLSMDMRFQHSTWRIGIEHSYLHYGAHTLSTTPDQPSTLLPFRRQSVSLILGTRFTFRTTPTHTFNIW